MRIAYISTLITASWGGSEELWYQSALEAINRKHSLGLFIYDWPNEPTQIKKLRKDGAVVYHRKRNISLLKRITLKIANKITGKKPLSLNPYYNLLQFKPDIIIVTDGSSYYTVDDKDLSYLLLNFFKDKYLIICQGNSQLLFPSNRSLAIELFENSLRVLFVSEHNRKLAFHQLAFNLTKTSTIQNPVLLKNFNNIPMPKIEDEIHCALVGRFSISDKGQDILISIMAEEHWKKSNIKLHLYGKGEDEEYLNQLIEFYNVTDKVVIEGFTEDRNEIWQKCHCLLMCSHGEGTSLAMLEALVVGRVCVITKVGGSEEWIEDGKTGFLVDAPTPQLFSDKLKEVINRVNDWESIGSAAHDSAIKKLDHNPGRTLINNFDF